MIISLEKIKTEYAGKIFVSSKNLQKYGDFCKLQGEEMALYELLERYGADNLQTAIEKEPSWNSIYNFSKQRSNVFSWLPMDQNTNILEIGAECGAVTNQLCQCSGRVDCIEASLEKCIINLKRNESFSNLTIYSGRIDEFEEKLPDDYDYILFSVAESGCRDREILADTLEKLNQHLRNNGRLVLAMDNRLGLKFFSGAAAGHENAYFTGITGFRGTSGESAYSKEAIESVLRKAGFNDYSFYYPYPDYTFMHTLFSDRRLPNVGELTDNRKNLEGNRMALFDEKSAFDSIIEDGCFDRFSNSFLIVTGKCPKVRYAKFSKERDKAYAMVTTIEEETPGESVEPVLYIKKHMLFNEGKAHASDMEKNYIRLCKKYSGCDLQINKCLGLCDEGTSVLFEYVEGNSLSEVLDRYIKAGNIESFNRDLSRYLAYLRENSDMPPFDKDIIFDNILVNNDVWTLIDYEWCQEEPYDAAENAFRSLHTFLVSDKKRNIFNYDLIFNTISIAPAQGEEINKREELFQSHVKGSEASLADINASMNLPIYEPVKSGTDQRFRFQIYRCDEAGAFSEANSFFYENAYGADASASVLIEVSASDKLIRLDPVNTSCLVKLISVSVDEQSVPINRHFVLSNGKYVKPDMFVFDTEDPNIIIRLSDFVAKGQDSVLKVDMDIYPLPSEVLSGLSAHISRF